ncbi:MAG TPA: YadA-like family protein [Trinickia sp.]|uniref:YadA family autotransporter adhesin n=1 Tax=Trinickia sp. TaxID=2571163 RepID=UPI002D1803AF|nr:YadA-like family protein [Trinickia sp.]HVW52679.1 YadA-like family protein [Trinickia sp.]
MGVAAKAATAGTVALGGLSQATAANSIAIGNAAVASTAESTALGSGAVTRAATNVSSAVLGGVTYGGFAGATPTGVVSIGAVGQEHQLQNVAAGQISATSTDAVNGSQLFSVATQLSSLVGKVNSMPGGNTNVLDATGTATGTDATAGAVNATSVGSNSNVTADGGTAVGHQAIVTSTNGTAVGTNSNVTGTNGTAIGSNTAVTGNNSVALGAGSVADRDNTVSVGAPGAERQITNVADGTAPTDAVNKRQLDSAVNSVRGDLDKYKKDSYAGSASAVALSLLPQAPAPGKSVVGVSVGNYLGQTGFALGVSTYLPGGSWIFKGGASTNTRGTVAVGGSAGYVW